MVPSTAVAERRIDETRSAISRTESAQVSEVGSQGSVDILNEDVERDEIARATGYLGKSSNVQWLRRAKEQGIKGKDEPPERPGPPLALKHPDAPNDESAFRGSRRRSLEPNEPLSAATYHLDDLEMLTSSAIDAYEMPTSEVSLALFKYYKSNTNVEFPFIDVDWVADRIPDAILRSQRHFNTQDELRDRALLNIIFAIGASYAHLVGDAQGDERDHFLYYSRARILGLKGRSFVDHPNIRIVQIAALTGFYYLCSSQINRAWMVTGYAIRGAFALGLHIRNEEVGLLSAAKEARLRLWWALWLLERQLVTLSGRPTGIHDNTCSVPRPSGGVFNKSTPSTDLDYLSDQYLNLRIDLAKLTQRAIDVLYSPSVVVKTWAIVQGDIETLENGLQQWRHQIPAVYDFSNTKGVDDRYARATQTLGLCYYMSRILITRPCLCGFDRRMNTTNDSFEFNQKRAEYCVAAAGQAIDLLPNSFDAVNLYKNGPWYSQVGHMMQASAIIMLEISFGASHSSALDMTLKIEKLLGWLHEMAKHNATAYRAWRQCIDLLVTIAPRIGMDRSNIDTTPPEVNPASEGRHHSVYPSTSGIEQPRGASSGGEDYQAPTAAPAPHRPHSQQPEFQPWPPIFHPDAPLFDGFQGAWPDNDFFAFDPSLMDPLDFGAVPDPGPLTVNAVTQWDAMLATASDTQQSAVTSQPEDSTMAHFHWEEHSGGGGQP